MIHYGNSWVCATCKPTFFQKIREGLPVGGELAYADFWIRARAKIIDWIIIGIVSFLILTSIGFIMAGSFFRLPVFIISNLIRIVFAAAYTTWFLGKFAATPGKMACRLKVVTSTGRRISYRRALGRHFAAILSGLILSIGYLMAAFDHQKRTLHDRICNTRVVKA